MLLNIEHIYKSYGDRQILDDVTLYLNPGDRYGIVGVNGAGKSTLLKIAAMKEDPDKGDVSTNPNVRIEYLSQIMNDDPKNTVLEQVYAGQDESARALMEYEAVEILTRLGITDVTQKMGELSGGQRKRVALATCLVHPADVLVLDEPTNHLDTEMIDWLEGYLTAFSGALLMVSHDRYFLERVATKTIEVAFGKIYIYDGGYSEYLNGKARREEMQAASERKRQSILRRELAWVLQGPCARGTKSRDRLERYEALSEQLPPEFQSRIGEIKAVTSRLGKKTIELKNVSKAFDGRTIIRDFDFLLQRDDRIGVIGRNGTGKSTLLNLISGNLTPDSGTAAWGDTVKIGYFSQHAQELDGKLTAIEYVKQHGDPIETSEGPVSAVKLMEKFLFTGDLQYRLIERLSGGEKRRLFLLGILASAPNVLLLDEPTNDLDIPTLTVLEEYLETFPGAIIAVSHDRYFLDRICHKIYAIDSDGRVKSYVGGYTDYWEALHEKDKESKKTVKTEKKDTRTKPQRLKFSFNEQREFETIDDDIAELESKIEAVEKALLANGSDYVKLQKLMEEQTELKNRLDEKMERWVYLNDLAESIANQQ